MIYSVWNQATRRFDYYKAPGGTATHAGTPRHVGAGQLGATPEEAAWPVPPGATKVGSGDRAIGRVATTSLAGWGFLEMPGYVVAALIATTFWYLGRRRR